MLRWGNGESGVWYSFLLPPGIKHILAKLKLSNTGTWTRTGIMTKSQASLSTVAWDGILCGVSGSKEGGPLTLNMCVSLAGPNRQGRKEREGK